ncbi:MAG TPA: hypothetical protein VG621_00565 [Candidatus Paceibacterota bacterium]|nr:hypothetical protein [Candidatus Paceibacterota bacterium]
MSIKMPRPVRHYDKAEIIKKKIKKGFESLKNQTYKELKEGNSRSLCEAIGLYMNGNTYEGCAHIYELVGIGKNSLKNNSYREMVKKLLKDLKNPQKKLFNT